MFCPNCGKEIAEGIKFCEECGANIVPGTGSNTKKKSVWDCFEEIVSKFYHFVVDGRMDRRHFWSFILFYVIFGAVAGVIDSFVFENEYLILEYYVGIMTLPLLSMRIKRVHDVGKNSWFSFIPIYSLILEVSDSDLGENEYGANPKENEE